MTAQVKRPQKSVWDRLAELAPEAREKYLYPAKNGAIRGKTTKKAVGGTIYAQTVYEIPEMIEIKPETDE